jgi:RNA-directed DNA polymerase
VLNTHQQLQDTLKHYHYVCKTDVKHFYETIDQHILIDQLYQHIQHRVLRRYLYQAIRRTVTYGGLFMDIQKGISRGCPISPLLGAFYLKQLDQAFANTGTTQYFYVRYMDDILILSKTRWQLRAAVKRMNHIFDQLKLKQHPDKTFIGRISRGFDFLGYHYQPQGLSIAIITVRKHLERCHQLYEQKCKEKATSIEVALALGQYRQRWLRWCNAGLAGLKQPPFVYDDVIQSLIDLNPLET